MMNIYEFNGKSVIDIDAEVPEEILEDIDWSLAELGDPVKDEDGKILARVIEITTDAVTIEPVEES